MLCYLVVLKYHRDLQLPQKEHKVSAICGNMKHKHRAVGLRQAGARSRGLVLRMYDLAYMLVGLQLKDKLSSSSTRRTESSYSMYSLEGEMCCANSTNRSLM
jgi:hypothetical protein